MVRSITPRRSSSRVLRRSIPGPYIPPRYESHCEDPAALAVNRLDRLARSYGDQVCQNATRVPLQAIDLRAQVQATHEPIILPRDEIAPEDASENE